MREQLGTGFYLTKSQVTFTAFRQLRTPVGRCPDLLREQFRNLDFDSWRLAVRAPGLIHIQGEIWQRPGRFNFSASGNTPAPGTREVAVKPNRGEVEAKHFDGQVS